MHTPPVTFLLVHGAWHGGWCWNKLTPHLRAAGHRVFTPTLTGLGERAHLFSPDIDLDTHIEDIVQVLHYERLRDVILVGHSYGGMVIAGVADRAGAHLKAMIYIDAFFPEDGKALCDYLAGLNLETIARDTGGRIPPLLTVEELGLSDPGNIAWVEPRLSDQPYRTFTQPVRMRGASWHALPGTFVQTSANFAQEAARAEQQDLWVVQLLSAGHDAMITQPEKLAAILLTSAERRRR